MKETKYSNLPRFCSYKDSTNGVREFYAESLRTTMNRYGCLGVTVVLGLAVIQMAALDLHADDGGPYTKGAAVTAVVPAASLEKVETKKKKKGEFVEPTDDYEVKVAVDGGGDLVLGGDPKWKSSSLPVVVAGEVISIKTSKRGKETTLTVAGDGTTIAFRLPMNSVWQGPLAAILVPGQATVSAPTPALQASLDSLIDAFCAERFTGPLDPLDTRIRRRVAEFMFAMGDTGPPSTSVFEGKLYFDSDLGEGAAVFNQKTTTAGQRTAITIADRVLPATKAWAQVFFGDVPFHGFRITATITHRDFADYPPKPAHDELEFYVSVSDADDYAADDLTAQQLIDVSTVMVNKKQVRLDVSVR